MSQYRLSDLSGVDRSHISRIESGGIGLPEEETREKFHRVFGTIDQDLVEAGILEEVHYGETRVFIPTVHALFGVGGATSSVSGELSDAPDLPPHLRASFLRVGELSPDNQKKLSTYLDDLFDLEDFQNTKNSRSAK